MKKLIILFFSCLFFLTSCAQSANFAEQNKVNNIVIALSNEPEQGFDPCLGWGRDGNPLIQSTLLSVDSEMNIINDLATSYNVSDNSLIYTFTIRDDVYFSDGTKLTAHDVAFTYETAKKSASVVDLTVINSINVIDDYTVEFILNKPQITFLNIVSQTGIVPKHLYNESYSDNPIGSGPFTLLQWNKGEQVIFGVNEHYYGIKPEFDRVTVLFMSDETAYAGALNGDIDVAVTNINLASNNIEGMQLHSFSTIDNRGITLPTVPNTGQTSTLGYPIGNNVTSDIAIRQALSYGIDRKALVNDCLNGYGTQAFSECDGMPWASEQAYIEYDLEYAKKLLQDASWEMYNDGFRYKQGVKAEFTLLYNSADVARQSLSFAVRDYAKELGINIILKGTSWDEIDQRMHADAVLMGFGSQNPMETYYLYHSSNKGKDYYNPEYFENSTVDYYLDEALSQNNYDDFLESYKKIQYDGQTGVSAKGEVPFLWLVNVNHLYFVNDNIDIKQQKIHPHGHSWPLLSNLNEWTWNSND